MIDRKLHQIWLQGEALVPEKYRKSKNSWQKECSPFDYKFWDHQSIANFMSLEYPSYIDIWKYLKPEIKKCDFARYLILHHFGGVYADIDTTAHRCVFDLPNDLNISGCDAILSEESYELAVWKSGAAKSSAFSKRPKVVAGNAVLLSRKGARIWIDFLEEAIKLKDETVLESFSTWHLSRFLASRPYSDYEIIDFRYLLAKNFDPQYSYVTHAYDGNWFDKSRELAWEV